jgi:hypothetical protein
MRLTRLVLCATLATLVTCSHAQSPDAIAATQQAFDKQFPPTKFSADKNDIVTAGAVLVLKKDGLMTYIATVAAPPRNTYKNGKFSIGFGDAMKVDMTDGLGREGGAQGIPKKTLVAGQKFWLMQTIVQKDKIWFEVVTDPYDDGRYFAAIKIDFPKGPMPSTDDLMKMVGDMMALDAPPPPAQQQQVAVTPPPPEPPVALAPIAPPPPPPDQAAAPPPTISLGEKRDDVIAAVGAPTRVAKVGTKEILYYKDMKVTLVAGKVSDVQ